MQDSTVHINWRTFNFPQLVTTVLSVTAAAVTVIFYIGSLEGRIAKIEDNRAQRIVESDKRFDSIQAALAPLVNLPYRVTAVEQQLLSIVQRIDRSTEATTLTMELIRKDVGGLSTKVEVLSSKIDALTPDRRSELIEPKLP